VNHGGPHDASEELYEKFDGIASQALIEEVVFEVQRDGILEWAPAGSYDYDPADVSPDQLAFDFYTDQPTEKYGSQKITQPERMSAPRWPTCSLPLTTRKHRHRPQ